MRTLTKKRDAVEMAVYVLFSAFVFWWGVQNPKLNWDMLAYVGSAVALQSKDADVIHGAVFSTLRERVGEVGYKRLTRPNNAYRSVMAENPELFQAQLLFYKPRIVYTSAIFLLSEVGVGIFQATYLLSAFFSAASVLLLFILAKQHLHYCCVLVLPLFMLALGIAEIATLSTPDALAMFVVLLSGLLISRCHGVALLLLPLSVLVRTDLIIWSTLLIVYLLWSQRYSVWKIVAAAVVTVIVYVLINAWGGSYGWQIIFYLTLVQRELDPRLLSSPLALGQYYQALLNGMSGILKNTAFWVFAAMSSLSVVKMRQDPAPSTHEEPRQELHVLFIVLPILYVLIHFLLFPVMWTRFFVGHYCLACLGFLWVTFDSGISNAKPGRPAGRSSPSQAFVDSA